MNERWKCLKRKNESHVTHTQRKRTLKTDREIHTNNKRNKNKINRTDDNITYPYRISNPVCVWIMGRLKDNTKISKEWATNSDVDYLKCLSIPISNKMPHILSHILIRIQRAGLWCSLVCNIRNMCVRTSRCHSQQTCIQFISIFW